MKPKLSPRQGWQRLTAWFKRERPTNRRDWLLFTLLLLTNIYVWSGVYLFRQIYHNHRTDLITRSVEFYPFPAGRVGTTIIPLSRYWRDVTAINQYITVSGTADRYKDIKVTNQVMSRLMRAAAIRRLGDRYNISVSQDEIEASYQATAAEEQNLLERNLQEYYGFTPADFKVWIAETLLERKVADQLPRKRHISQILYSVDPGASAAADEKMKQNAEAAVTKLRAGADFAELAKQDSNDATSRDNGGDIGWVSLGTPENPIIDDAFQQAAFSAPVGEIVGPIRGTRGWHIILVREESGILDGSIDSIVAQELNDAGTVTYIDNL